MAIQRCSVQINQVQREVKEHGDALFPIGFYYDYLPSDDVPWHWHGQLEIGQIEKGRLYLGVNSDKIILETGDAFFINSEVLHSCWCEGEDTCTIRSMVFKPELLGASDSVYYKNYVQPLLENSELSYSILKKGEKWQEQILEWNRQIWESAGNEGFGYEFSIRNDLSKIILHLLKFASQKSGRLSEKAMRTERRMKQMLRYISENYGSEITIGDIAASAMISESECMRCFHNSVGISPMKYVRQLRIQNAAELLTATDRSVNDIADQCGFQDMSYFTKTFREVRGMTPSEFRKRGRDGESLYSK